MDQGIVNLIMLAGMFGSVGLYANPIRHAARSKWGAIVTFVFLFFLIPPGNGVLTS